MFDTDIFSYSLRTYALGRNLIFRRELSSTNELMRQLCITSMRSEGTLVVTDHQTHGRGRGERDWYSGKGKNLTFSFLLYPKLPMRDYGLIALLAGIAVVEGIRTHGYRHVGLKWPNDIIAAGKKIGGILTESFIVEGEPSIIVGIGLNVNEEIELMPEALKESATSLQSVTRREWSREKLLASILYRFEENSSLSMEDVAVKWESSCVHQNKPVRFHGGSERISGRFLGLTHNGYARILVVGTEMIYSSGEIEI